MICIFTTNCKHAKILSLTVVIRCLSLQTFFNTDFLLIAMESNDITTVYLTDSDSRDVRLNHISGYPSLNGSSPKYQSINTRTGKHNFTRLRLVKRLTFLLHSSSETFLQPAEAALISLVFVDHTNSLEPTSVNVILPNASSEETFTAITTRRTIVFARRFIATNQAGPVFTIISCNKD